MAGRSCQEAFHRLIEDIHHGLKERKITVGCFLDISKAFDAVWCKGVKFKLIRSTLPNWITRILGSFLEDRQIYISNGTLDSRTARIEAGAPQGGVNSPGIYTFYTYDLPGGDLNDDQLRLQENETVNNYKTEPVDQQ